MGDWHRAGWSQNADACEYAHGYMKLSTGRYVEAYRDTIGIDHKGRIRGGFDSPLDGALAQCPGYIDPAEWDSWTREEKLELADLMLARWAAYRAAVAAAG